MGRRIIILGTLAALLLAAPSLRAEDGQETFTGTRAEALRQKAINGFGGLANTLDIKSIQAEGVAEDPDTRKPGTYTHYLLRDGSFRMDLLFGPRSEARLRSGLGAYVSKNGGKLVQLAAEAKWRVFFEQRSLGLIFDLTKEGFEPEYSGVIYRHGRKYEKLTVFDPDGPALLVYLEDETGRVVMTEMDSGFGLSGIFTMEFSDFREKDGILMPHSIREAIGGKTVLRVNLSSIGFNTRVSPFLFQP